MQMMPKKLLRPLIAAIALLSVAALPGLGFSENKKREGLLACVKMQNSTSPSFTATADR